MRARCATTLLACAALSASAARGDNPRAAGPPPDYYRPRLATPEVLEPFQDLVQPGADAFAAEREAAELAARLAELADRLKQDPGRASRLSDWLLAPGFRGGRLFLGGDAAAARAGPLEIRRSTGLGSELALDATAFAAELRRMLAGLRKVALAEFLITAIDVEPDGGVRSEVRYDVVGPGTHAWRVEHTGVWRIRWRRDQAGWRALEWTAASHLEALARAPAFSEVTGAVLGRNDSFRRQLGVPLDDWSATFDSVLTRDSNGHHGVSVGDADGDGLDDLYVAQPAGLSNRLYRARADGSFEDATETAGLAVLDDTAQSLFADVDNDGDQDLVLATGTRPLLFVNDGGGRFALAPDGFRFDTALQGSLTSIAMADYDRDGFLDLYLCVYSYFYGAGEDKAGTPAPYYDARNGPPGVLFRNDGRGRFVDATREAGLEPGNDRYHFAAAWADYDGDGWQDLLVANDFGTKNLYRNRGRVDGRVVFEDVAAEAGVLDHGAGMSAAFLDYDNDGRLDIYTGNMWSDNGRRVTSSPAFMKDAPPAVRELYRRHARGNSLFRNLGDGRFEDVTLRAGVELGRWAWSSDSLDFDSDGFDDLYVVNGMLTRAGSPLDLDGFFWRQVVARSPLTRVPKPAYDDAWRAINQLLIHHSIASRQRNVFLRNDGRGGFDDVSGAVGLDLDQDGRSFAVLDFDRDGDPDIAVMAARQTPQLRLFRNDVEPRGAVLSLRLVGTGASNRDAVGARAVVEAGGISRTRIVRAGSGFISQHSRELIFGLAASERVAKLAVHWPSGLTQAFFDLPANQRLSLVEGGELRLEPIGKTASPAAPEPAPAASAAAPPDATWLYEPFPAPDFSLVDQRGEPRSLRALRGRPAVLLFFAGGASRSSAALETLARGSETLALAGIGALAIMLDDAGRTLAPRSAAPGTPLPVARADEPLALAYAILNRHVFMNRQDLRLPTAFLLDAQGRVVKAYRDRLDVEQLRSDGASIEADPAARLARALPFPGTLYSPPGLRNYLPYGRELLDQGLEAAALVAFERAAQASPSASTLYYLGTLLAKVGQEARARAAFEQALAIQPDLAEANNDLGTLLAQSGDLAAAITRFRAALDATPDYPDALNNLGYALLLTGQGDDARALYEKALRLQPDFPEALNNLGLLYGRSGDLDRARPFFEDALARRSDYGEAANNLALVLVARGLVDQALELLRGFLERHPEYEGTYLTLAKIYLSGGRSAEGLAVLERLLQRNPTQPVALELVRQWQGR